MNRPTWRDLSSLTKASVVAFLAMGMLLPLDFALRGPLWVGYVVPLLGVISFLLLARDYRAGGFSLRPKPLEQLGTHGFWTTRLGQRLMGSAVGLVIVLVIVYFTTQ